MEGAASSEAGPSSKPLSATTMDGGRKVLPDFFVGSYEDALRKAQRELRVLCAILISNEHDDVREFKLFVPFHCHFLVVISL